MGLNSLIRKSMHLGVRSGAVLFYLLEKFHEKIILYWLCNTVSQFNTNVPTGENVSQYYTNAPTGKFSNKDMNNEWHLSGRI